MKKGFISKKEYEKAVETIKMFELPVNTSGIEPREVTEATLNDKKMDSGIIKFILLMDIGNAIISREIAKEDILNSAKRVIVNE